MPFVEAPGDLVLTARLRNSGGLQKSMLLTRMRFRTASGSFVSSNRSTRLGRTTAIRQEGRKLLEVVGRRQACLAGTDDGQGMFGVEVGHGFFLRAREKEFGRFRGDSEKGFAEAEDAGGGGFQGLRGR